MVHKPIFEQPDSQTFIWHVSGAVGVGSVSASNEQGETLDGITRIEYRPNEIVCFNELTGKKLVINIPVPID